MQGKIIKIVSNDYTILSDDIYICKSRGKFRNLSITPKVGDDVVFDKEKKLILEIKKRKNELIRPYISNIDQVLIIVSCKDPNLDLYLLDKLLCLIEYNNIKPIICFTKLDLVNDLKYINELRNYYTNIGYKVFYNNEIDDIKHIFKDKISVLTGQSGSGKSTLLNKLNINLNLETNEISHALGRGKHTTRYSQLISIYEGLVADTPGFSSLDLSSINNSYLRDNFIEFNLYKDKCKYRDCMHLKEDECEIKRQVGNNILKTRYESYQKLMKENL